MYTETKDLKDILDSLKSTKSEIIKKIDIANHQSPEFAIKQILENQGLFLELLGNIYEKLLDLDKKYEMDENSSKYSNTYDLTKSKVSVNQIIFDAINITKNYSQTPIRLGLDVDIEINADSLKLLQVLSGILQNSTHFTREGQVKIESFVVKNHNLVIIRICDTGEKFDKNDSPGIKPSENKVYKNSRFDKIDITNFEKIISSHNGKLEIKNNDSIGVTFHITLPIK